MSRRKSGPKKPREKRPKEATQAEQPLRSEIAAKPAQPSRPQAASDPPLPPTIKPELPLPPEPPHSEYKPSAALVVAVVLTAILEVLDITIVSVAIPHMLGTFGATSDQITWVLTSYLVSAAVVMPLTGYLSARLGRRRLLIFSIVGFVVTSALCGLAWNLESMVVFRLAQGICGAPLVPLSQAILLDAFPKEKHGQALAIFGVGIMVAPVLGPTFGGWLTDTFVWRAVFYINVPIGMFALLLAMGHLPKSDIRQLKTDWTGLVLLILAVGSLQMVLDQGQNRDWFDSRFIQIFTAIAVFSSIAFFMRGWNNSKNIVDLSLLKDRNFLAGLLAITAYGVTLFGTIALLPLLTQRLMGYPAMSAGMLFIPRAVASAIALSITGNYLMHYIDPRILVAVGIILSAIGTMMMASLSLQADAWAIAAPGIIAGIGMGLFFVPLTAVAFGSVRPDRLDEAAGLYALMRGIGSSIGIAVVSWLFVRQGQVHWDNLISHISPFNPALAPYLSGQGPSPQAPGSMSAVALEIGRQAQMLAFVDLFWFIGLVTFAILPLVFMMKRPKTTGVFIPAHA
jgi:DHA2 family multidrug resistance protein